MTMMIISLFFYVFFRLRCYMASLQNGELPNPKGVLQKVNQSTKAVLNLLGVFTVSSFHAYICARSPSLLSNLLAGKHSVGSYLNFLPLKFHVKSILAAKAFNNCPFDRLWNLLLSRISACKVGQIAQNQNSLPMKLPKTTVFGCFKTNKIDST